MVERAAGMWYASIHAWDFGDGATGEGPTPSHLYTVPGVYVVGLMVTDSEGTLSACTTTAEVTGPQATELDLGSNQVARVVKWRFVQVSWLLRQGGWMHRQGNRLSELLKCLTLALAAIHTLPAHAHVMAVDDLLRARGARHRGQEVKALMATVLDSALANRSFAGLVVDSKTAWMPIGPEYDVTRLFSTPGRTLEMVCGYPTDPDELRLPVSRAPVRR